MDHMSRGFLPLVLTVGMDHPLEESCGQLFRTIDADGVDGVLRLFYEQEISVLILGPRLTPVEGTGILARFISEFPVASTAIIVLCAGLDSTLFQKYLDERRIFYLSRGFVTDCQLRLLVVSAAAQLGPKGEPEHESVTAGIAEVAPLLDFCTLLSMQSELSSTGKLLIQTVREMVEVDSVQCLVYDPDNDVLTPTGSGEDNDRARSASAGFAGFVERTHEVVRVDRIGDDFRYDCDCDKPGGDENARLIALPISADCRHIAGVILAVRNGQSAPFSANEQRMLSLIAECAAPKFSQILWQNRLQAVLAKQAGATRQTETIRAEEAGYSSQSCGPRSDVLRPLPPWLRRTQWALVAVVLVSILGGMLGRVDEYASGPVVIRAHDNTRVITKAPGRVTSVEICTGDHVKAGDASVRLDRAEGGPTSEENRSQVPAAGDGIVGKINVHLGQFVKPGDQVVSMEREQAGCEVVAFMPGIYAHQLRPGMPLQVSFHGGLRSHEMVPINSVSPEFLTLGEAARYAGTENVEGSEVPGPVVIVRSFLHSIKFPANPAFISCRDGIAGEAEVRIHSVPIIVSVFPALKKVFGPST